MSVSFQITYKFFYRPLSPPHQSIIYHNNTNWLRQLKVEKNNDLFILEPGDKKNNLDEDNEGQRQTA